MGLNKAIIMGRLTADPELKRTQGGVSVVNITVAVDRNYKTGEKYEADFFPVVAWRGTAEFVCKYFAKGRMAVAEGRLQVREWKDRDGSNRRSMEVVAESVYFADSKKSDAAPSQGEGFREIDDEGGELPF